MYDYTTHGSIQKANWKLRSDYTMLKYLTKLLERKLTTPFFRSPSWRTMPPEKEKQIITLKIETTSSPPATDGLSDQHTTNRKECKKLFSQVRKRNEKQKTKARNPTETPHVENHIDQTS